MKPDGPDRGLIFYTGGKSGFSITGTNVKTAFHSNTKSKCQEKHTMTIQTTPVHVTTNDRIVRLPECSKISGRSPASISRDEKSGTFPKRVRLGENSVGWRISAILKWLSEREEVTCDNCKQVAVGAKRGRKPFAKVEA